VLADDIADRIAIACHPDELEGLITDAWVKHRDGRLTANDLETLQEAALARMNAFPEGGAKPRAAPQNAPRATARRPQPREKLFGNGRPVPLDREAKARIGVLIRALMHPTEPGKHYGAVTAKAAEVGRVLLWVFHNAGTGRCFPSYDTIAKAAGCHRDTVAEAIKMLEAAGILTWCNRRARVTIGGVRKVIRISNAYRFIDPRSKSEFPSGTKNQEVLSLERAPKKPALEYLGKVAKRLGEEEARREAG
jgi:hypothetical protein